MSTLNVALEAVFFWIFWVLYWKFTMFMTMAFFLRFQDQIAFFTKIFPNDCFVLHTKFVKLTIFCMDFCLRCFVMKSSFQIHGVLLWTNNHILWYYYNLLFFKKNGQQALKDWYFIMSNHFSRIVFMKFMLFGNTKGTNILITWFFYLWKEKPKMKAMGKWNEHFWIIEL